MVKSTKSEKQENRKDKGSEGNAAETRKINASTLHETCSEQLSPFSGLLAMIKFCDLIGFGQIFHYIYRAPSREPKLGHYRMVVGILMLLFIGFNIKDHGRLARTGMEAVGIALLSNQC